MSRTANDLWRPEQDEALRLMWPDGKTHHTEICKAIGRNYKACRNRASILKITRGKKPVKPREKRVYVPRPKVKKIKPKPLPIESCKPVTLLQAVFGHCRSILPYKLDKLPMVCGNQTAPNSSYCPAHHALYWRTK